MCTMWEHAKRYTMGTLYWMEEGGIFPIIQARSPQELHATNMVRSTRSLLTQVLFSAKCTCLGGSFLVVPENISHISCYPFITNGTWNKVVHTTRMSGTFIVRSWKVPPHID